MDIRYISWDYGTIWESRVHLIRLTNGQGLIRTSAEMVALGLAVWKHAKAPLRRTAYGTLYRA